MRKLNKYSIGIGDRFGLQGKAQLRAVLMATKAGALITPVWNKSHREHLNIGSTQMDVRMEADEAVNSLDWKHDYFVDADHVGMKTVNFFLDSSDFFTIDVAGFIGKPAEKTSIVNFSKQHRKYFGSIHIPNVGDEFNINESIITQIAGTYLRAIEEAGRIYRYISSRRNDNDFIIEISMDETQNPQTPIELFFILSGIAQQNIPIQTIAPKFSGQFNKGIDYNGDISKFKQEFEQSIAVIKYAVNEFGLPFNLKLSVHSGSDKFSIYPAMREVINTNDVGLHLKTAGTTWLEELIGLAEAGHDGLDTVKDIYRQAFQRFEEMIRPYRSVVNIDRMKLPQPDEVFSWNNLELVSALRHDQSHELYNPHVRQLLHVSYKIAAEMGLDFLSAVKNYQNVITTHVTENLYERHLKKLFV